LQTVEVGAARAKGGQWPKLAAKRARASFHASLRFDFPRDGSFPF
jgi:hypothetical protein